MFYLKTRELKGAKAPVIPFKNKNNNSLFISLSLSLWPVKMVCKPLQA